MIAYGTQNNRISYEKILILFEDFCKEHEIERKLLKLFIGVSAPLDVDFVNIFETKHDSIDLERLGLILIQLATSLCPNYTKKFKIEYFDNRDSKVDFNVIAKIAENLRIMYEYLENKITPVLEQKGFKEKIKGVYE